MFRRALLLAALLAPGWACGPKRGAPAASDAGAPPVSSGVPTTGSPPAVVVLDALEHPSACSFGHEGVVLDLGETGERSDLYVRETVSATEREGATWARVSGRTLLVRFALPAEDLLGAHDAGATSEIDVDARVRSLGAKSASVYLDGKALGTVALARGETRVVSTRASSWARGSGPVELLLRFNGVAKASADPVAEIDWIRVGNTPLPAGYAPATRADVVGSHAVAGVTKRALSLVAPGFARCLSALPKGASIEFSAGVAGKGGAELLVRVAADAHEPREIARISATDGAWRPVRLTIPDDLAGGVGIVEVVAASAPKGVRALFADLRVTEPARGQAVAPAPRARNAVVVVLGHTPPSRLALAGGALALPNLEAIARQGLVYDHHRATSPWAAASFASVLTGLPATSHCVEDDAVRLADDAVTLARAARDAGMQTALFSANPTAGATYGLERDFATFQTHLPPADPAAVRVFDDAASWIDHHASERFLVVLHARGGHPPWEVSAEEGKSLAPEGYTGPIDGRHAAEVLAKARRIPPTVRFSDADRTRAWSLFDLAMRAHDDALGRLVAALKASGHDRDTAIVVTGDVGVSSVAHVPFGDELTFDESALAIPLIVAPAGGSEGVAAVRRSRATSSVDVARTVLGALGLPPPQSFGGVDLLSSPESEGVPRILAATAPRGRVSLRLGDLVLHGTPDRASLCDVGKDLGCASDVSAQAPVADVLLRAELGRRAAQRPCRGAPVVPDSATSAALKAWGR